MSDPPQEFIMDNFPDAVPDAAALSYFNYRLRTGSADDHDRKWMHSWVYEEVAERHRSDLETWARKYDEAEDRREFHRINAVLAGASAILIYAFSNVMILSALCAGASLALAHKAWVAHCEMTALEKQINEREEKAISQGFTLRWTKRTSRPQRMYVTVTAERPD